MCKNALARLQPDATTEKRAQYEAFEFAGFVKEVLFRADLFNREAIFVDSAACTHAAFNK